MDFPEKRKPGTSRTVKELVAIIIITSSVIAFLITLIQLFFEYRSDLSKLDKIIEDIYVTQADTLGHLIWNLDEESIRIVTGNNTKIDGIEFVELKSFENRIWKAGKVISGKTLEKIFPVFAPRAYGDKVKVGDLKIIAGVDPLFNGVLRKGFYILLGNIFNTILVAIVAIIAMRYILTRHLIDIGDHINKIFEGNFTKKLSLKRGTKKRDDELDLIVSALNSMGEKLEKSFSDLEKEAKMRKANELALRDSEERLRSALDHIPDVVTIYSPDLRIRYINIATKSLTGIETQNYIGKRDDEIWPEEIYSKYINELKESFKDGMIRKIEADILLKDKYSSLIITIVPITGSDGIVREVLGITRDITEKVELEMQLNHARKMEAIGILAGGIAHDFNNILSIIIGYGQLLSDTLPRDSDQFDSVMEINNASERAKNLIKQLLAFSRKQVLNIETVDINQVVNNFRKLLEKLITENISIRYELMDHPGYVKVDISQLEQVIVNLVINARDAIDKSGEILIKTDQVYIDETYSLKRVDSMPGYYVMLSVSDTGKGMDTDLLDYIFDPFFTTKEKGKGTGLGLSTVYGIVKQHNGNVWVYSEPDNGSVFKIYLPLAAAEERKEALIKEEEVVEGSETIMIIEDEAVLKSMIIKILSSKGFVLIDTDSSIDAVKKASEIKSHIDLVITDVIMPDMNGPEVFKEIKNYHPDSEVLYMSGYSGNLISNQGVIKDGINFLEKPFSKEGILKKVDQILSERRRRQKLK